jgi:hypothetical protein
MLKLVFILAVMLAWGAWLIAQDEWGVTSFVCIPAFVAAFVVQAMLFRILPRPRKEE